MVKCRYTTQGVHLFDRESGINILLEEIKCPRGRLSIAPANISIALSNRCNRNCIHCFAPKEEAELEFEEVCCWLDELDANDCLGVGFGGGEPLMYRHINEICKYVHDKTDMACTLTTNADFLDDNMLEWMSKVVNFIRISTNGNQLDFERIRMAADRLATGVNYLLNKDTLPMLPEVSEKCSRCGVKEILLLPQITTSRCDGVDESFLRLVDEMLLTHHFPLRMTVSSLYFINMRSTVPVPGDSRARQYLHISADGLLKRSSLDLKGIKIGNDGLIAAIKEVYSNENMDWI